MTLATQKVPEETQKSRCSEADTHSPFSLPFLRLRYSAMAVPMTASSTMAPMIPPMMVPVVGPFPGRRVPAGEEPGAHVSLPMEYGEFLFKARRDSVQAQ